MLVLKSLICLIKGHVYFPHYTEYTPVYHKKRKGKKQYKYNCERCGKPTIKMGHAAHEKFKKKYKPDWGNR